MTWTPWTKVEGDGLDFDEILYEKCFHTSSQGGVARVSTNKPHKLNTMTLRTVCLLYTSPSPRDRTRSRMPSSA